MKCDKDKSENVIETQSSHKTKHNLNSLPTCSSPCIFLIVTSFDSCPYDQFIRNFDGYLV